MSGVGWPRLRGFVGQSVGLLREHGVSPKQEGRPQAASPRGASVRASFRRAPSGALHKERMAGNLRCSRDRVPQGSDRPAGGHVGKALRASLVLGGGCPSIPGRQPPVRLLVRSVCLSPKHTSPSVSGRQPGAPPAHPTLNRLRGSAGGDQTCPVFENSDQSARR